MMTQADPRPTQAGMLGGIAAELAATGFTEPRAVGHGGFGTVYRCEQPQLGRTVAVKVLSAVLDQDNYERFQREQYAMGRLSGHPNIATILQVGVLDGGWPYIVMPFYPGDSLDALIRRDGPFDWPSAVRVGVKLAGALETAHRAGILHRDVKPANILLTEYSEPQLTDFGIARVLGGYETAAGLVAGSLAFTAPEVLAGGEPSVVADVYGLGATLFNLVAGHPAFERKPGEELVAQFLRITREDVPDLRGGGIPADLVHIIERAMARDPSARPASAAALGERLRDLQHAHGIVPDEMAVPTVAPAVRGSAVTPGPHRCEPAGPAGARYRLPVPLTSFVGREREVREITALLRDGARLVTLTGPGGVGKSRLALQVATELEATIAGGVPMVELGTVGEADHVVDIIARALRLGDDRAPEDDPIRSLARRLVTSFGTRKALIVLNNCEHLAGVCGRLIETLLSSVPGLQLLVTSQRVLGIAGEHIYAVAPLSLPDPADIDGDLAASRRLIDNDAVRLFVDRAKAVVPGFTISDAERLDIARLCAQLDGIPLVIELAAARLRTFSVGELLSTLKYRFRLLSTGSGAGDPRHRTLQALVDWSYDLLTPDEREVWLAASLFAGEFTADAVVEVCAGASRTAPEMHFILASLVDKSMVESASRRDIHQYRLLVTLREYAAIRLTESGRRDEAERRYVDRYRRMAEEFRRDWFSPRQVDAYTAVHGERENLRAALTYCETDGHLSEAGAAIAVSLYYYWLASTTLAEGRRWLAEALDSPDADPPTRARALWNAAVLAFVQDDVDALREHARAALAAALACGDRSGEGYAHLALGFAALSRGDVTGGLAEHRNALEYHRAVAGAEGAEGVVNVATGLITALGQSEDATGAAELWAEAVALCEQAGDRWHLAYLMYVRGYHLYNVGDFEAAWAAELESLRLSAPFADQILVAYPLDMLSWIAVQRNDFENAARLVGAAGASWASAQTEVPGYGVMADQRHELHTSIRSALGGDRMTRLIENGRAIGGEGMVTRLCAEW